MGVDPGLKIGEKVNLQKIREIFQCGSMGGMLPVNRTNVMVIIADHTLDFYHDKWKDGILYYTGTGKIGDQQLDGNPGYKMVNYIIQKPMGCNCIYLRFLRNANIFIEE